LGKRFLKIAPAMTRHHFLSRQFTLVLFRHGIAEPTGPDGTDASRRLTDMGQKKTDKAAKGLAKMLRGEVTVMTSPLVRAKQTAMILGKRLESHPVESALLAGTCAHAMRDRLIRQPGDVVVAVGHQPTLGWLAELLLGVNRPRGSMALGKAGAVAFDCLRLPSGCDARLKWFVSAKMLRKFK
jgi:phosphohistidine phosphatase SixA